MHSVIDIAQEPRGETYQALLRLAAARCERFSLVWCDEFTFHPAAWEIVTTLEPHLTARAHTDTWPGTQLLGHKALVGHYRLNRQSLRVLQAADGLYSWLHPGLPEDLAFYSAESAVWLATISHEQDSWFEETSLSRAEILRRVPGIVLSP